MLLQRSLRGARLARAGASSRSTGASGKIEWSRELASRTESSPLVADGRVYFGSENGTVYAMDADDGNVRWRFRAGGAVKGGLALADGKLYFGDYGGRAYAIRESNGASVWRASTNGGRFGLGSGNFYSTPAVALRARLHGQHRRARLLVLRGERQARVEQEHRRLRLRLAGGRAGAGRSPARLRRLLQRPLLRARRAQRRRAVVARRQREDLRRRDRDRRHRLLRRPRQQAHDRARRPDRPQGATSTSAAPTTPSCPTARRST